MPEETESRPTRGFVINPSLGDWLKLLGYAVGLFVVYMQMDSRVHALELQIGQMKVDSAAFAHADVLKVRDEALSDQLREITRRLGNIESKVDAKR